MRVEFITDEKLFAWLPAKRKTMWHRHSYEISSGDRSRRAPAC